MKVADAPFMNTYPRGQIVPVRGEGAVVVDADGNEYLDFLAAIACVNAGHCNPVIADALAAQARKLDAVSNLFYNEPAAELVERIVETAGWTDAGVFLANSGAEANEAAIKVARKWAGPGRYKIVCAEDSFHGRTLATLAATGQPSKWAGFEPLPAGFAHAPYNDLDAFAAAIDDETAAIMVEPVLGEGGVIPATPEFLAGLRTLADERNVALIFDEIQTGVGRTGTWWAFQNPQYGVEPDIFTSAKALANGLPIGACVANGRYNVFSIGDHGSTFGGGPVIAAAANATLDVIATLLPSVNDKGDLLRKRLADVPGVASVRGLGLHVAAQLETADAGDVYNAALERGAILNPVRPDAIRFVPPLSIEPDQIDAGVRIFADAVAAVTKAGSR